MTDYKVGGVLSLLKAAKEKADTSRLPKNLKGGHNKASKKTPSKSEKEEAIANDEEEEGDDKEMPKIPVGMDQIVPKLRKKVEKIKQEPSKKQNAQKRIVENRECEDRTIFVGNVPPQQTNNRKLKKLFTKFGKIEAIYQRSLLQKNRKLTLKMLGTDKEIEKNLNSTNFFIRFKDAEQAKLAVQMNGSIFEGNSLRVTLSAKKELDISRTIFVGNLPFVVEEQQIRDYFTNKCGQVESVRVLHDRLTGRGRGIAYVAFQEYSSVFTALKLNESEFMERKIRVTKALKKNRLEKEKPKKILKKNLAENRKLLEKIGKFSTLKGHKTLEEAASTTKTTTIKNKMRKIPRNVQKVIKKRNKQKSKSIMN